MNGLFTNEVLARKTPHQDSDIDSHSEVEIRDTGKRPSDQTLDTAIETS